MPISQIDIAELEKNDFIPQAIFNLEPEYFAERFGFKFTSREEHGLGNGQAAAFKLDSGEIFALARYQGHPTETTTVYISRDFHDEDQITGLVNCIRRELAVDRSELRWQRRDGPEL